MKNIDFPLLLTPEDKVRVAFKQNRGKIEFFIVQYYALVNGRWRTIIRIDTCHGQSPHKHTYHPNRRPYKVHLSGHLNTVFTEADKFVKQNFKKIKENYLNAR